MESCCRSRRSLLAQLGAIGAGAIAAGLGGPSLSAVALRQTDARPRRIDVHHHMLPPAYAALIADRIKQITPNPAVLKWTLSQSIDAMDRYGIATSILSLPIPGAWHGGAAMSSKLARIGNEFGAKVAADHRARFGFFASVPLPDVQSSLAEIAYALDTLRADGIALQTSYDSRWPGDQAFAPVFDELNRRKAVVFVHPTEPACCAGLIPGVPSSMAEFLFDTSRAVISLLAGGTLTRCPDIRFIFCHSGGTLPVLAHRIAAGFQAQAHLKAAAPNGALAELRRLHYEVANATNPSSLAALMTLVPSSQILWGSDYPYREVPLTVDGWEKYSLDASVRQEIERGNAGRLLPRFAGNA